MNHIPDGYYRTSIKALILNEEKKFLLAREENGIWELLGGGLDFDEHPHQCLKRELKEEAGLEVLDIEEQPSYFVTATHTNETWKSNVLYKVEVKDLNFTPSDECVELRFFTKEEAVKERLYPTVAEFVKAFDPLHR